MMQIRKWACDARAKSCSSLAHHETLGGLWRCASLRRLPTGRLAEPEDIADVIVCLASDAGRHIIGQLMHVNGGDYLA
jgi:NAD(P)-dependent dehydrogenase (short-subunit alcohol dehydrogenase family)